MTGEKGKQIDRILSHLEKLSRNPSANIIILDKLKELDERGTLERVDRILSKIPPLTRGDVAKILQRLERAEKILEVAESQSQ